MKLPLFRLLILVVTGTASALLIAGCSSKPTIAPNWYDSSFDKDGATKNNDNLRSAPVAGPGNY